MYIWFREQAVEHESCNDGAMYSRVARLCRSDNGGPRPYSNEWTSFVKARLNCSIPGHYPFYFDQVCMNVIFFCYFPFDLIKNFFSQINLITLNLVNKYSLLLVF